MITWNPWHGCHKISPGCQNCYMFRRDMQIGKDSTIVTQTKDFYLPLKRNNKKFYLLNSLNNPIYLCMTSDFLIEEADAWRRDIWKIIRYRSDLEFKVITKRIHRLREVLPPDWGSGYRNLTFLCTCENQETADARLPVFLSLPIAKREIIHEPMLERIDVESYLQSGKISAVTCGGESGDQARICDYDWILHTREQCMRCGVDFSFKQTGARFRKDGRVYTIDRRLQMSQAKKAGIDYRSESHDDDSHSRYDVQLYQLSKSKFRSSFFLNSEMAAYCRNKGMESIRRHADDFIRDRLAPAHIPNDGKQTPTKGHPVFVAQHATATCCRGCLSKWYDIPPGYRLTEGQINDIVGIIMEWITRQLKSIEVIEAGGEEMKELFRLFEKVSDDFTWRDCR